MKAVYKKLLIFTFFLIVGVAIFSWARWRPAKQFEKTIKNFDVLRVVTWNVGYFAAVENKNMKDLDIPYIAEMLVSVSPDVVVLQELGAKNQAEVLAEILGPNWKSFSVNTGHGKQVVSILTHLDFESEEDVECGGRFAKGISVRWENGKSIYIFGIHSPHPSRGISANLESIKCSVAHTKNRCEDIRILAGDMNFNFGSSNELYREILEFFGDSTKDIGETYYAHTRIDHMFHFPKNLKVLDAGTGIKDIELRFAPVPGFRDHRPIIVSYRIGSEQVSGGNGQPEYLVGCTHLGAVRQAKTIRRYGRPLS